MSMLSANKDNFTSFFSNLYPFASFSCLVAQACTSNILLNRSGEKYMLYSLLVSFWVSHVMLLFDHILP